MIIILTAFASYGCFHWCYLGFKGRFPFSETRKLDGPAGKVLGSVFGLVGFYLAISIVHMLAPFFGQE